MWIATYIICGIVFLLWVFLKIVELKKGKDYKRKEVKENDRV